MAIVTLKLITTDNWRECCRLKVSEDQKFFVAPNMYSLAESAFEPDSHLVPLGIYDGEDMVGFTMYGHPSFNGKDMWFIFRLMVAADHQKKGIGRTAMQQVIKTLSAKPDCDNIYVSFEPENTVAAKLYEKLGFLNEGEMIENEVMVRLPVEQDR